MDAGKAKKWLETSQGYKKAEEDQGSKLTSSASTFPPAAPPKPTESLFWVVLLTYFEHPWNKWLQFHKAWGRGRAKSWVLGFSIDLASWNLSHTFSYLRTLKGFLLLFKFHFYWGVYPSALLSVPLFFKHKESMCIEWKPTIQNEKLKSSLLSLPKGFNC